MAKFKKNTYYQLTTKGYEALVKSNSDAHRMLARELGFSPFKVVTLASNGVRKVEYQEDGKTKIFDNKTVGYRFYTLLTSSFLGWGAVEVTELGEIVKESSETFQGYHLTKIPKAGYGTAEKIQEECLEFMDAVAQSSKVMQLVELSDMIGAIEGYLEREFSGLSLEDLKTFSDITKRAFKSGRRS